MAAESILLPTSIDTLLRLKMAGLIEKKMSKLIVKYDLQDFCRV
jgi:hypothetical protein